MISMIMELQDWPIKIESFFNAETVEFVHNLNKIQFLDRMYTFLRKIAWRNANLHRSATPIPSPALSLFKTT